jgi:hypothetical protein
MERLIDADSTTDSPDQISSRGRRNWKGIGYGSSVFGCIILCITILSSLGYFGSTNTQTPLHTSSTSNFEYKHNGTGLESYKPNHDYGFTYHCNKDETPANPNGTLINSKKCMTPECEDASNVIRNKLDLNVNPCEDFYHFACGGWMKAEEKVLEKTDLDSRDNFGTVKSKLVNQFEG